MEFHISETVRHIKYPKTVSYWKNVKKILGAFENIKSYILKKNIYGIMVLWLFKVR